MSHTTIIIHSKSVSATLDDGTPLHPPEITSSITFIPDDSMTPNQVASRVVEILRMLHRLEDPGA